MLKKLGLIIGLLFISAFAKADYIEPDRVYQVGIASVTVTKVTVSNSVATQVDTPTMPDRVCLEVQNIDSTANLWCVPGVAISSAPVNGSRKIAPGASWVVSIIDKVYCSNGPDNSGKCKLGVYCTSDGTGSTNAIVTQIH